MYSVKELNFCVFEKIKNKTLIQRAIFRISQTFYDIFFFMAISELNTGPVEAH